jgi:hypothetical protein
MIYAEGLGTQQLQTGPYILELLSWFVPGLAENLISTRLLDEAGYLILIENNIVQIRQRDVTGAVWHRFADTLHGDLYRVYSNQKFVDTPRALYTREYSTLRIWHNCLGHREFRTVGELINLSVPRRLLVCSACLQGKMKASSHLPVLECCHKPFEHILLMASPLENQSTYSSLLMTTHGLLGSTLLQVLMCLLSLCRLKDSSS